jgi:multiple sugar transport system substrate-binding protein
MFTRPNLGNLKLRTRYTLSIVVFLLGLTSCSSGSNQIQTPTENQAPGLTQVQKVTDTPATETTPEPVGTRIPLGIEPGDLQGISIQFWYPWNQDMAFTIEALVDQFNLENGYGILVSATGHSSDLYQDVLAGISAGIVPDIAAAPNNQIQSWDTYGNSVVDMNVYVEDPDWGLTGLEISDFYPVLWEQDLFEGKRLGLPTIASGTVVVYNQTWAQELGFESPPTTPVDFKTQACAAATANNDGTGGWIASMDPATMMSWIFAFGGNGLNREGNGYDFDTPEVEEAFDYIKALFESGCAWVPEDRYPDRGFATRQGLFYTASVSGFPYLVASFDSNENDDEWRAIPFPSPNGEPVINLFGPAYTILRSTPEKQLAAWLFITWLIQPENQARLIEASNTFPVRKSVIHFLEEYAVANPQWAEAQDLISYGFAEPKFGSWGIARWTIGDVATELVSPDFASEGIPFLLEDLNAILVEIHFQNR